MIHTVLTLILGHLAFSSNHGLDVPRHGAAEALEVVQGRSLTHINLMASTSLGREVMAGFIFSLAFM